MSTRPAELVSIGDISVDTMVAIDHIPRRDEKQWAKLIGDFPGGMAANVAVTFARLGGRVRLIARVGRDQRGRAALRSLRRTNIDIRLVKEVGDPTFWTLSLIDRKGERSMVEFASPAIHPPWASVGTLAGAKAVYTIGSEAEAALGPFHRLQARGVTTAVDADYAEIDSVRLLDQLLGATTVFFCNSETACRLASVRTSLEAARRLAKRGPKTVVVTLGRLGALAIDRDEGVARVRGHSVEVVDSTGAGDCFAGTFLFARTRGWPLKASVELANLMAAASTTAYGCQSAIPAARELLALPGAESKGFRALLAP